MASPFRKTILTCLIILVTVSVFVGCAKKREDVDKNEKVKTAGSVVAELKGKETTIGKMPHEATKADLESITVGMINADEGVGAYPTITNSAKAAVDFLNAELGGVEGHVIKFETCSVTDDPASGELCAQEMISKNAVVVIGGLIPVADKALAALQTAKIPYVGGIPTTTAAYASAESYQFNPGPVGSFGAASSYAVRNLEAETVSILQPAVSDIESFTNEFGIELVGKLGAKATVTPVPADAVDFSEIIAKANETPPDVFVVQVPADQCVAALEGLVDTETIVPMIFGSECADEEIIKEEGEDNFQDVFFPSPTPIEDSDDMADLELYRAVVAEYADSPMGIVGFGPQSFRDVMNIYNILKTVGFEDMSSASIENELIAAKDIPGFLGKPYSCDAPLVAVPSLCSPDELILQWVDGKFETESEWINLARLKS